MSNYERFKSMTKDELRDAIVKLVDCPACPCCTGQYKCEERSDRCEVAIGKWLDVESEE